MSDQLLEEPDDSIEAGVRRIHRMSVATGFGPLTVDEIYQILRKVTPRKAINGSSPDDTMMPPVIGFSPPGRDALFRSTEPINQSIGPVINPIQRDRPGATGMTGLFDDPRALQMLRNQSLSSI